MQEKSYPEADRYVEGAIEHTDAGQLRAFWHCEERLEYEHLEWLRLMAEAEWYG